MAKIILQVLQGMASTMRSGLARAAMGLLGAWLPAGSVQAQTVMTTLVLAQPTSPIGLSDSVLLQATVSPGASGSVTFRAGMTVLATVPVDVIYQPLGCPAPVDPASTSQPSATQTSATADACSESSAIASFVMPAGTLAPGSYSLNALYTSADASYGSSKAGGGTLVVSSGTTPTLPPPPTSPASTRTFEYDAIGNPTKVVQAPGTAGFQFNTQHGYDALSRRTNTRDALNGLTQFGYDGQDQLTQVTDPRQLVTRTPRDGLGNTTQLASPDTGTAAHSFDAAGRLLTRTDSRGVLASYSYDALNRLTGIVYSQAGQASQSSSWAYDQTGPGFSYGIGRLTTAAQGSTITRYRYDALGRVLGMTQTLKATSDPNSADVVATVGYAYDAAGHVTGLTYPSGRLLTCSYTDGQVSGVTLAPANGTAADLISQIQFSPFGAVKQWQWAMSSGPQGHDRVFDTSGRLVRYRLGNYIRDLSYDAADRITAYTHYDAGTAATLPALNQSFGYDALGRLVSVNAGGSSWSIGYDANGNRTAVTLNGVARSYTTASTSNRLLGLSNPARSFGYDNAGNTLSDSASYTASYGLDGRLSQLSAGGRQMSLAYDANGLRVRRLISGGTNPGTTYYAYDQQGQLLGEYALVAGQLTTLMEYVWLEGMPVAAIRPTAGGAHEVFYIHSDHLGAPRVAVDQQGRVRWRWMAEPFGMTAAETNPAGLGDVNITLRLPGQQFDGFVGLHYNVFRDYDPTTGRYVQSDPIGLQGGINTYVYVENQPTKYTDPLGLETYICTRPLGGAPGSYAPPLLNHTYVCVGSGANMTCGSTTASSGGVLSNILPGSPGKPTTSVTDYFKPEACERRQGEDSCIETCIANELKKPTRPRYAVGPAGTDCQEYTEDVVSTCERRCVRR